LDASLLVFVEITLNRGAPDVFEQFNAAVQKLEEIQECHLVSGVLEFFTSLSIALVAVYFGFSYLGELNFGHYGTGVTLAAGF
ncbi:Lrp/AsnC ligand binding domain-containing protein, partial [Salmonella enterica subsp. enterica serovar Infantis]